MCYQRKCLMCMPVKTVVLVLAILNAIGSGLIFLASVITGVILAAGGIVVNSGGGGIASTLLLLGGFAAGVVDLIIGVASLISFIFYVLLCNGICKRRPGQVKVYFIFGITMMVLWVMTALGCAIVIPHAGPAIIALFNCVIYSLFLVLVHQTYFILLEEAAPKHYIPQGTQPQRPYP